jgi:peptide/nickel transport system permease protein
VKGKYLGSRILQTVVTLFVVSTVMWVLFRLIPGDPASMYVSGRLTPEDIVALKRLWGLDLPLHVQYLRYMVNLFQGNFGVSFAYREPVMEVLSPKIVNTLILMVPVMVMAIVVGTILGSHMAWRRGGKMERLSVVLSLFFRSYPIYLSGILILMIFAHWLDLFPLGGMRTIGQFHTSWIGRFLDVTHHLALPFVAAFLYYVGDVAMIARTSMLEVVGEEFLEFAKARGLSSSRVRKIAMRNAIIPVITYSTILVGFAFGGQVLLEMVFSWPGIGKLMADSVQMHDYPVAQAAFFIMAVVVISANLLVDLFYGYLDPRITYGRDR